MAFTRRNVSGLPVGRFIVTATGGPVQVADITATVETFLRRREGTGAAYLDRARGVHVRVEQATRLVDLLRVWWWQR